MTELLSWRIDTATLYLKGTLDHLSLQRIWQQRNVVMQQINTIDLSSLVRVDSAGLALLIHLQQILVQQRKKAVFIGISEKVMSLINLYNLQKVIVPDDQ